MTAVRGRALAPRGFFLHCRWRASELWEIVFLLGRLSRRDLTRVNVQRDSLKILWENQAFKVHVAAARLRPLIRRWDMTSKCRDAAL